ncbi:MAG: hypothetical protein Q4G34_00345 [Micrococcus sp.]|nr:hypothetical protein [Micrococcus sp.]
MSHSPHPRQPPRSVESSGASPRVPPDPAPRRPLWVWPLVALSATSVAIVAFSFLLPVALGLGPGQMPWYREFFDVNHEANFTAWWNTGLLLAAGLGFLAVMMLRRRSLGERGWASAAWLLPGVLLTAMSLDELSSIHERFDDVYAALFGENPLASFQWLALGVPVALVVIGLFVLSARTLPSTTSRLMVVGILIFFLGAIVVESIPAIFDIWRRTWAYMVTYHVEELLEFLGAGLLAVAPWAAWRREHDEGRVILTALPARWRGRERRPGSTARPLA